MKKLITIILSLAMILPAAAIADTEQELLGTWVGTRDVFQGDVTYFFVRLYADHEAIYETRSFDKADTEGMQGSQAPFERLLHFRIRFRTRQLHAQADRDRPLRNLGRRTAGEGKKLFPSHWHAHLAR